MTERFPELVAVVLDATEARALAEFYVHLLGYGYQPGDEPSADGAADPRAEDWLVLRDGTGAPRLAVQAVESLEAPTWPAPGVSQQLHLDFTVPTVADLAHQRDRAIALGARVLDDRSDDVEESLIVFADPAGHPFCIIATRSRAQ